MPRGLPRGSFTLFLTVALGYLVGEINIKVFSLGSGAVLFVGLAIRGFAPKAVHCACARPYHRVYTSLGVRLPFDTALGVISGATGNPDILAFASRTAPTDRPDDGYAMIFRSMTILKILFVQIAAILVGG